jgi:hypothetical protein
MGRAYILSATLALACGNDMDPSAATTSGSTAPAADSSTSGTTTSTLSQTSTTGPTPSTSTGPLPPGCGAADLDPCASIRLPPGRDPSNLRGWSSLEDDRRMIVAADPPVLCGNAMPADCHDCPDYVSVEIDMPADLEEPGSYEVSENDIAIACGMWLSSCPGMSAGGEEGGAGDPILEVLAVTPTCVAILDPCHFEDTVILTPLCD